MKKITFALAFLIIVGKAGAQQNWTTSLMDLIDASEAKIGTKDAYPMGFYIDGTKRMTLDIDGSLKLKSMAGSSNRILQVNGDGVLFPSKDFTSTEEGNLLLSPGLKFGIGVSSPEVALDVNGEGKFSGNVKMKSALLLGDDAIASDSYGIKYLAPTNARVGTLIVDMFPFDPYNPPAFIGNALTMPCTAFPVNDNSIKQSNTFAAATVFRDLVQVFNTAGVTLNMGVNNGHGIISVENGNAKLRLNPGCSNDVFICEGGGFTKIFNSAGIVGDLGVSHDVNVLNTMRLGTGTFNHDAQLEVIYNATSGTDAVLISNPDLSQGNNKIFEVTGTGQTLIGHNLNLGYNMLTVGQPDKTKAALCLTDNTTTTNKDFFKVYGNGYTEINIYSPIAMPNERALAIKDKANNKDLFVVKSNGKVYAREVEISLVTSFPDYVFNKDYALKPITEVAAFIADHRHLPGFEKGEYYEKNGINVNDMLVKQQEKIEELTLYIIEMEKRLQAVEKK